MLTYHTHGSMRNELCESHSTPRPTTTGQQAREEEQTVYQIFNTLRLAHGLKPARVPRPYISEERTK
jgi:hypothetical protein